MDNALATGEPLDLEEILSRINSRLGYFQHFDEIKMIRKTVSNTYYLRDVFGFTHDYKKAIIKPLNE